MRYPNVLTTTTGLLCTCLLGGCQTLTPTPDNPISVQVSPSKTPPPKPIEEVTEAELSQQIAAIERNILSSPTPELELEPAVTELGDVWQRMRNGYALPPATHPKVIRELRWYRDHPGYIERIQERARPYIHFILDELEQRHMPLELALLPAVESAFQPYAYSPGRAAGIWQFIPSTGRSYGLKQNWWYDGRRDILASTHAALDYLKHLNQRFDGDWELALAAYNAGAGTVQRAMRKNRSRGEPTDYWSLQLPRETRNYVPRLLALSRLFARPEENGITLQTIPDLPFFGIVEIESQLDLSLAAQMSGITVQDLFQLNPGFNRWATDPDGPHRLLLPLDKMEGFVDKLARLPTEKRLRWKRYRISRGDSLSVIAQRHDTTVQTLKQVNKLSSSRIRAGRHLLIPLSSAQADPTLLSSLQSAPGSEDQETTQQHHVVEQGDSLWRIARLYRVDFRRLAHWNDIASDAILQPGQELVVELGAASEQRFSRLDLQPENILSPVSYKVRRGDSLYRIAERFRVTVPELKKWNSLSDHYLQPGQRIKLYVDVTEQQTL